MNVVRLFKEQYDLVHNRPTLKTSCIDVTLYTLKILCIDVTLYTFQSKHLLYSQGLAVSKISFMIPCNLPIS